MSLMGIAFVSAVVAAVVYGFFLGARGMFADFPPFMQGEGKIGRFDDRMNKKAA